MLANFIRILNFDDSLIKQKRLLAQYKAQIIDFTNLRARTRFWIDRRAERAILERIEGLDKSALTLLGSGDYHNVSSILLSQFQEPITLIVFDFHPDWDILPPRYGCGSWVTQALRNKNIVKCLLISPCSDDLSCPSIQSGNLKALKDNRLEIYPYTHEPTRVYMRGVPQNNSIQVKKGFLSSKIQWSELRDKNLAVFLSEVIKNLPSKKVYISLDKDCLRKEYVLTNWEEGRLSLDELMVMLKVIKDNADIVGMDITGDYSPILGLDRFKNFFSRLDHPKEPSAAGFSESYITLTNESANLKILGLLNFGDDSLDRQ